MKFFVIFLSAAVVATASPIGQEDSVPRGIVESIVNCKNSDLMVCLKENILKLTERAGSVRKLNIFDGLTIYNTDPKEPKDYDALPVEREARSMQLSKRIWESTSELLQNSELEVLIDGADDKDGSRSLDDDVEEGRGKKKKQLKKKLKLLIPLAIMAKVKAVALVILALLVIAASLFKLAVLAKIAFIAKVIAIVKALIAKKHSQEEHTWVTTHEEHPSHGGWDGGWSRSRNEAANSLAYSAYQQ
ncbi:uncharacterized protein [Epargyreus clarus]|uniref:uncharacterized protein n=1 Tax=Epargyreus clarus TaxID=520877 RepID=UPI003C2F2EBA